MSKHITVLLIFILSISLSEIGFAGINLPFKIEDNYQNPYHLISRPPVDFDKYNSWKVAANQEKTPVFEKTDNNNFKKTNKTANFLQVFDVEEISKEYLRISPVKGDKWSNNSWIKIKNLISLPRSIKNSGTYVNLKAFPRIRINAKKQNIDSLKPRKGPGEQFNYVFRDNDALGVGSLFLYVYGVYFNNEGTERTYQDVNTFLNADWFLVGIKSSVPYRDTDDDGNLKNDNILGWLSHKGCVLWDTRQALEPDPERGQYKWAHLFEKERHLTEYIEEKVLDEEKNLRKDTEKEKKFLDEKSDYVIPDQGQSFVRGQDLRYLVIRHPLKRPEWQAASIGYSPSDSGVSQNNSEDSISISDFQEGLKYLDIFFLIDATSSMNDCFPAAAKVVKKIMKELPNMKIKIYAALYRDTTSRGRRYEYCPSNDPIKVSKWIEDMQSQCGYDSGDTNMDESLFFGINQAMKRWNFSHKASVRILVTIGDAGDDGSSHIDREQIINQLKKNFISPLAVYFEHDKSQNSFINDFKSIQDGVFGNSDFRCLVPVSGNYIDRSLSNELTTNIKELSEVIRQMPLIRMQLHNLTEVLCDIWYKNKTESELNRQCRQCSGKTSDETLSLLRKFVSSNPPVSANSKSAFFTLNQLRLLQEQCPECVELLNDRPSKGFAEYYVATSVGKPYVQNEQNEQNSPYVSICKPVYLLSWPELREYKRAIEFFIGAPYCDETVNREQLINAISLILGEGCQAYSNNISDQVLEKWFGIIVERGKIQTAEALFGHLCENIDKWENLLKRFEKVPGNINDISGDNKRIYKDANNQTYFWVSPEELFPPYK